MGGEERKGPAHVFIVAKGEFIKHTILRTDVWTVSGFVFQISLEANDRERCHVGACLWPQPAQPIHGGGSATVIFMAGILSIPEDYFEAARLEGGTWVKFRHVIIPMARNATFTVILLSFIGGLRSFDLIWTMTRGGPGFASDVLTSVIYKEYQAGFYGLSTAGNVVLFVLVTAIVYPLMRYFNSRELDI